MSTQQDTTEAVLGRWQLDPRTSSLEFRVHNLWGLMTVKGHFDTYRGQLQLSASPAIELTIEAASVQTGQGKRDEHLRARDFFDVENHPRLQLVSDAVELHGNTLSVRGRLSARGRSIPVELDAQVRQSGDELDIEATTTVPHRELGMTWSPLGMISRHTKVLLKAHLVQIW